VDAATYNGAVIPEANLSLFSNGAQSFSFMEAARPTSLPHEGVNLAGGQFGSGNLLGTDYIYPTTQEIDYYLSKGMNTFRVPFKAAHLLDNSSADDLAAVDHLVGYAATKGVTIILDMHDFGYTMSGKLIGRDAGSVAEFADEWSALAAHFKDESNVAFGLMNEPNKQTAAEWLAGANAAIQVIREQGATQEILVPGSYWDGAHNWVSTDNDTVIGPGVKDSVHNYVFEVHQYLDFDYSGTHSSVVSGSGSTTLADVTDWARAHGEHLFLGEFSFAPEGASMAEGKALVDFIHANPDVWQGSTYWAAGPWWGNYMFSAEPTGLGTANVADKPQMAILSSYLVI
jgi:endoglucanase